VAQWQNPRKKTWFDVGKIGFCHCAAVFQTQVSKLRSCAQPYISVSSTFGYEEHIANSLGKTISYRSAFAFRSPARALAAGLPRQDHMYKTADESFRFNNKNFDEMRCKLDSTENPRSFEKYPTLP